MRIAQVAPLYESVPPRHYGGTERVVSYLTDALVDLGHDVTLFASGDSVTRARLEAVVPQRLWGSAECVDTMAHHVLLLERVMAAAWRFDVIHFHIDYLHFPLSRGMRLPHVTTLHGRLDLPDLVPLFREFADMPVVSISDAQRRPLPWVNWVGTVHHGLPPDLYTRSAGLGDYLAFVGRISPEKRADRAIAIARRAGVPLKIAAKIDPVDRGYFEREIQPLLNGPLVEYLGELDDHGKQQLLCGARALLFPIDWPEPFGLVIIEALASGTPVVAWPCGSVPELVDDGVTGYIVDDVEDAARAVDAARRLSRWRCRHVFESRFTAGRMAHDYVRIYERAIRREAGHFADTDQGQVITPPESRAS
ncbi:MAG: glycosyltransferase family 4 protein [Acidobacteria bacterium]|nr:MAG: glycosyltransferase family 4 protein [Acidobacteriota bacterium]